MIYLSECKNKNRKVTVYLQIKNLYTNRELFNLMIVMVPPMRIDTNTIEFKSVFTLSCNDPLLRMEAIRQSTMPLGMAKKYSISLALKSMMLMKMYSTCKPIFILTCVTNVGTKGQNFEVWGEKGTCVLGNNSLSPMHESILHSDHLYKLGLTNG